MNLDYIYRMIGMGVFWTVWALIPTVGFFYFYMKMGELFMDDLLDGKGMSMWVFRAFERIDNLFLSDWRTLFVCSLCAPVLVPLGFFEF